MSLVEDNTATKLLATLGVTSIISTRLYPNMAAQGAPLPYVTYQVITDIPENTMNLVTVPEFNTRLQIDCWSATYITVKSLQAAVRAALSNWRDQTLTPPINSCIELESRELPEDPQFGKDTPTYRVSMDFSIWHN